MTDESEPRRPAQGERREATPSGPRALRRVRGVAYATAGAFGGEIVVLLHSLGADGQMWDECIRQLSPRYRLVIPDTRGHGASDPAADASVEAWVADLKHVLDECGTDRAILVGVSLGGIQAVAFAAAYPTMVQGLVIADSFVALADDTAKNKIDQLCTEAARESMERVAEHYIAATFERPYPAGAESVRRAIAAMEPASYISAVKACFGAQIDHCLDKVAAPTLVLWGDRDVKTPRVLSERIAKGIAGAHLTVVPDAGHLSNVDNPDGFAQEVITFITRRCTQSAHSAEKEGTEA